MTLVLCMLRDNLLALSHEFNEVSSEFTVSFGLFKLSFT